MRSSSVAACVASSALLWACAPMQYTPKTATEVGYSETQLAENVFDVHYSGSGWYDPERISDFLLLRSAELCQSEGYAYFEPRTPAASSTASSSLLLVTDPIPSGNYARVVCFHEPGEAKTLRLETSFVTRQVRDKYGL